MASRWKLPTGALALLGAVGCGETLLEPVGQDPGQLVGEGGTGAGDGGGTGGLAFSEGLLHPKETGWVDSQNNPCRAQGPWYAYNDCNDSRDDCTRNHLPEEGEFPNIDGRMCTTGTTAIPADETETALKWGAGIGLFLNQDAETEARLPLGLLGLDIVGIRFTLVTNVPRIRISFPIAGAADTAHMAPLEYGSGTHAIEFKDAISPPWDDTPVPLKPEQIISVQFQVPTSIGNSYAFDYCIEDLTLLL